MREYRASKAALYFGITFTLLALIFPGLVGYQLITGARFMVGRSYNPMGMHAMTNGEMLEFALIGIGLVGFGLLAILDWRNSVYQTTTTGIRKLTTFRKVMFCAEWKELRTASRRKSQNGQVVYTIATASAELEIPDTKSLSSLRRQIQESAPHVNYSHWTKR